MKAFITILFFAACTNAFRFGSLKCSNTAVMSRIAPRMMSEEPTDLVPLVPVDRPNVESAAAVTGGILGFVLGGPLFAAILAAVTNYVSKKEGESGEALRGVGKTVVESYNFLTKLNAKYDVTGKVTDSVSKAFASVETESEALQTVKSTINTVSSKVSELNAEYDLVSKGKEIVAATASLTDAAIDKVVELNNKVTKY